MSSPYDEPELLATPLLASVELHAELPSTNDRAKQLAAGSALLPCLIVAEQQTAGRGRGSNQWWSSGGSLTFSLLLAPSQHGLTAQHYGGLSLATAAALCDTVASTTGAQALVKWPNDVLIGPKKIAGVLLESPAPDRMVIGVGLNVNNHLADAPAEVRGRATSLLEASGEKLDPQAVLVGFLDHLEQRIKQLADSAASLQDDWRRLSALSGKAVTIESAQATHSGRCAGIGPQGELLLETDDGLLSIVSGTVIEYEQ